MLKEILIAQNPHWQNRYKNYSKRDALDKLISYLPLKQIITITGIRRCGKSTLAKQAINYLVESGVNSKNIFFINLEHPYFLEYRHNPNYLATIFDEYLKICNPQGKIYTIFDEIQYFDNWQVYIKSQYENSNTKYIIAGSNSSMLSGELNTLLSGRSLNIHLETFSFTEFLHYKNIDFSSEIAKINNKIPIAIAKEEYLLWGGFYEVFATSDENIKKDILLSYAKNIIYQDIIPRYSIRNNEVLERLFFYLLENTCSTLNYTTLAKTFNISDKTIKEYIKYFEEVFLFKRIDKFHNKTKERIKSSKKIYTLDNGLLQIAPKYSKNLGNSLENWVFNILNQKNDEVHYLKDTKEIDFYVKNTLYQVCFNLQDEKTKKRKLSAFKTFESMNETHKLITYDENTTIDIVEICSVDNLAIL
jgi:predicted AAA+ superfamily ATPase